MPQRRGPARLQRWRRRQRGTARTGGNIPQRRWPEWRLCTGGWVGTGQSFGVLSHLALSSGGGSFCRQQPTGESLPARRAHGRSAVLDGATWPPHSSLHCKCKALYIPALHMHALHAHSACFVAGCIGQHFRCFVAACVGHHLRAPCPLPPPAASPCPPTTSTPLWTPAPARRAR